MKLLFFTLAFILSQVVAAVTVVDEREFSSIIITAPQDVALPIQDDGAPGGASSLQSANPSPQSHAAVALPRPLRKYQAEDVDVTEPFGHGSLFIYNDSDDFGDIATPFTHRNILKRLKDYKENEHRGGHYKDSNLLLVRIRFTCIGKIHSFECSFGMFASGVTKKYESDTIPHIYAGPKFLTLNETLQKAFVLRLLLENGLLQEYCKLDVSKALTVVDCNADVYPYKLFKLEGQAAKRVIFSNIDYVKQSGGFNNNLLQKVNRRLWGGEVVNDEAVKKYFGCGKADLFEAQDKLGIYFNQSEQAFFSALEADDVGSFFGSNPLPVDESGGEPHAYNARVDMYSYLDICVICRGCIARLLENRWLTENIQKTIRAKSGNSAFAISAIEKVYAHSVSMTDTHITKRQGSA